MSTRADQRRLRQLENEREQRMEDNEALKMTEEQHETLLRSFQSVKFEFNDLDGLSWTDSIKRELQKDAGIAARQPSFVVLTEADLASFASEETIRPSAVRTYALHQKPESPQSDRACVAPAFVYGKRDGTRARSPVKGLFSAEPRSTRKDVDDLGESPASVRSDTNYIPLCPPPGPQTDAGVIASIFCSSAFTTPGRKRSQTYSITATPKSSPSLAPVSNFASP
ncbi:hypothetical protein AX14_005189 [Amanita brunnescens Koide BX004]|nr:hypothetical protein AX14_005189 [Amanita brunnescens Koide BX004]